MVESISEALSYVWGSENQPPLLHLRDHQLRRKLWIDALCINQDDDDETSAQIPLMRAIYVQANCVTVWLGESIEDGGTALKMIRRLALAEDQTQFGAENEIFQDELSSARSQETKNDICLKLLQRAWFQRIWVLQEIGVARCISIICGSVEMNGHVFFEGVSTFYKALFTQSFTL
ncbi:HET domain protein [Penicillium malachiteum]|uniref:HET domain protein n=1 Tax=Penicillium malachiteum TaxID=1324776 RepID=UPI002546B854|nr:HET domain protein [Penicillium malachiteum]KAJ5735800.1 HET domain protein [Penicillium malachiteum]